jgi:hypothetical protein
MRIVSGILWLVVAVVAALMGLLLISDEPGATAARWYLGFAVLSASVGVLCLFWLGPRAPGLVALASLAVVALIALHAFLIVAFAYQGLTILLLIPAVLAGAFAGAASARNRA